MSFLVVGRFWLERVPPPCALDDPVEAVDADASVSLPGADASPVLGVPVLSVPAFAGLAALPFPVGFVRSGRLADGDEVAVDVEAVDVVDGLFAGAVADRDSTGDALTTAAAALDAAGDVVTAACVVLDVGCGVFTAADAGVFDVGCVLAAAGAELDVLVGAR